MLKQLLWLFLLVPGATAGAASMQSLESIEQAVGQFVSAELDGKADLEFSISRLDPRLRLPLCSQALDTRNAHAARGHGPISVEVRCNSDKPWVLYVPVQVVRYAELAIVTRSIARHTAISAADLKLERVRVDTRNADYLTDPGKAVGLLTTRALSAGQILRSNLLQRPRLVRRGDKVTLRTASRMVSVKARGEALEDGVAGERINVLNLSSQRVIEGTVEADGVVVVGSPRLL